MKFSIKTSVKSLKRATRRALDAEIAAVFGGMFDDAQVSGTRVWRRIGSVEFFDNTTSKMIYGDTDPETLKALREVMTNYGCEIA